MVIRAGALGDVLLALPALAALRARYPNARVTVAGYPALWEIARGSVDEVVSIDDPAFASLFAAAPSEALRRRLRDVDLAVAWTVRDPSPSLRAAGIPEVLHTSPYPPPGIHAADWLCESLASSPQALSVVGRPSVAGTRLPSFGGRDHGDSPTSAMTPFGGIGAEAVGSRPTQIDRHRGRVPARDGRPTTHPHRREPAHMVDDAQSRHIPHISLHPGAGAAWKRWPVERFAVLADALLRRGHDVALVEGPADAEAVAAVQAAASHPLPVLREASLPQLAERLAMAHAFVGNDSGLTHLAAALSLPTVAIFGPTDPASWAPRGTVSVLRTCRASPARQGQIRVCDDPACLEGVTVPAALAALDDLLAGCR